MQRLSKEQRESLQQAVSKYHAALPGSPAEEYLAQRGLAKFDGLSKFRFGYVEDPDPEHEKYRGKLAIPYLRRHPRHGWTVVSIRFRALDDSTPKYLTLSGDKPRLFNTQALTEPTMTVGITEGELDACTATLAGLPTVGIPGATSWQEHWRELFLGYKAVLVFTDGDDAGDKLGRKLGKTLPNARVIPCPEGEDMNSLLTGRGVEAVQALWGGNEED